MKKVLIVCLTILFIIVGVLLFTRKKEFYPLEKDMIVLNRDVNIYDYIELKDIISFEGDRTLINNYKIDTSSIGKKDVEIIYYDLDHDKR